MGGAESSLAPGCPGGHTDGGGCSRAGHACSTASMVWVQQRPWCPLGKACHWAMGGRGSPGKSQGPTETEWNAPTAPDPPARGQRPRLCARPWAQGAPQAACREGCSAPQSGRRCIRTLTRRPARAWPVTDLNPGQHTGGDTGRGTLTAPVGPPPAGTQPPQRPILPSFRVSSPDILEGSLFSNRAHPLHGWFPWRKGPRSPH